MGLKRVMVRVALLLAAVSFGLATLEIGLRFSIGKTTGTVFVDRPGYERSRGMKRSYEGYVHGVPVRTNELGFRDNAERLPPKSGDTIRIVVLGDSFTAALGVPFEQIFSSQLQSNLAGAIGDSGVVPQVINLGVGGYNLIDYELTIQEVGWRLEPDLVLVALLVANDFRAQNHPPHAGRELPRWHRATRLWQVAAPRVRSLSRRVLGRSSGGPGSAPGRPRFGPGSEGWVENSQALLDLQADAKARGVPVVVALLPATVDFRSQQLAHQTTLEFCRENELHCFDLLSEFLGGERSAESYRLNLIDGHPNADYHRIVGRRMSTEIARLWNSAASPWRRVVTLPGTAAPD